jgi:hypothetical protein
LAARHQTELAVATQQVNFADDRGQSLVGSRGISSVSCDHLHVWSAQAAFLLFPSVNFEDDRSGIAASVNFEDDRSVIA